MDVNRILFDYIVENYGDASNLSEKSGIPPIELNAVLLKDNVLEDICIGFDLCGILNIDVDEIVFNDKIRESARIKNPGVPGDGPENDENTAKAVKNEIYGKCIRLSEIEKRKVLEYIENILNEQT